MKTTRLRAIPRVIAVLIVLGLAAFPLYWMFVTSLTPNSGLFGDTPALLPDLSNLGTYVSAVAGGDVPRWLGNTLVIATGTCVAAVILALPFAYALSRFGFRGKVVLTVALFVTQMLPEALLVVPLFSIFNQIGLLNSLLGLAMANAAFVLPIVAFILKGAFDAVPRSLDEAACMDGCGRFAILMRINLPLVAPSVAATAVIAFFHGWNEYIFAVTFIFDEARRPASVGLSSFVGELSTPLQTVMAVSFMYTIPAVVFYLIVQRYMVANLAAGAVKG